MSNRFRLSLGLVLVLVSAVALAADPSAHQIYQATRAGNIAQAEQMVAQVLRDHPHSAKAHFVAAEVEARAGNFGNARNQLAQAESIAPGLPFASPRAVRDLQRELGMTPTRSRAVRAQRSSHLGWALLLIGGVLIAWVIVRRRMAAARGPYPGAYGPGSAPMGAPPGGYPPGGYPPPGYGPGYGQGSGVMGSLASGLAIGAGVAAGEELVGHMLGGNSGGGGVIPEANAAPSIDPQANADLGGNDFGLNDPGSWDDGSGGGGWDAGGDDSGWT